MARHGNIATKYAQTTPGLFLPPRRNRVALVLFPSVTASGDYSISNDANPSLGSGVYVRTTGGHVQLDAAVVGDVLTQPLFIIAGAAQTMVGYVETIDDSIQ